MSVPECIIDDLCGLQFVVDPGTGATVGRRGDVIVGRENQFLHRHVLKVFVQGEAWVMKNVGSKVTLMVRYADEARGIRLAPRQSFVLDQRKILVYFAVKNEVYEIAFHLDIAEPAHPTHKLNDDGTDTIDLAELSDRDRSLVAAFAEDYLTRQVESIVVVRSDRDVAARLGITEKSVQHRRESLYRTIIGSGLVGDSEWRRIQPRHRIIRAVEAAIELGLVTVGDIPRRLD